MVNYWGIRIGRGGQFVPSAKKGKFIAIGWKELGDLNWVNNLAEDQAKEKLQELAIKTYTNDSNSSIGKSVGQVLTFIKKIKINDIVLVVDSVNRKVMLGQVISPHEYRVNWDDDCEYQNRRSVKWIKEVNRDDFSQKMQYSLGALLSVFNLSNYEDEIKEIIDGSKISEKPTQTEVVGEGIVKYLLNELLKLDAQGFEKFVTHLLNIVGFNAVATQLVRDGGFDAIGELSVENLAHVTLRVQVKRVNSSVGDTIVRNLRGTLGTSEHGAIITTATFTQPARQEAEAENKIPICLIDGEQLVEIILNHYNELDEEYKNFFNLKERNIRLVDKFIVGGDVLPAK